MFRVIFTIKYFILFVCLKNKYRKKIIKNILICDVQAWNMSKYTVKIFLK